jgi:DNA-binding response OmpR family regulator
MTALWVCGIVPSLDQPFYRDEHLFVDLRQQVVILDGEPVRLTRMQYLLLALLVERVGEVVTRAMIFTHIWGYSPKKGQLRVAAHIHGLRRKLGVYADHYIETVYGVGYRFRPVPGL